MKTLNAILIILLAALLISGAAMAIVDAGGTGATAGLERETGFRSAAGAPFEGGREEHHREGSQGWLDVVKNIGIMGVIVAVIVLPQKWIDRRRALHLRPQEIERT